MKRYGYHRTSTREQHLDRGIKEITAYCEQNNLELEKIFTDQQTGKNFNRPRYQVCQRGALHYAITKKRLTSFGLVSMLDYYTEKSVTC
ncbi:MAG: recombinase family protein [Lachnospiraceae bacterium]|nr:recombinase family protein [Lachnospiraceae bacterium]